MQVRKLIRLLNEMATKHGDRCDVCIDAERYRDWKADYEIDPVREISFAIIDQVDADGCLYEHGKGRKTIILNKV